MRLTPSKRRTVRSGAALLLTACLATGTAGAADEVLPSPLSLASALATASATHPERTLAMADAAHAEAALAQARSANAPRIDARLDARYINPPPGSPYPDHNDSSAALVLRKPIYDFGRSRARTDAAAADVEAARQIETDAFARQRLEIMRRFFDVLLADQRLAEAEEAMAVAYVEFDRARDRNKLGQLSDIDLLAREDAYQTARSRRAVEESAQRTTRALLADAIGRPDALPDKLLMPALKGIARQPPDYASLLTTAQQRNPTLASLRARMQAAQAALAESRAEDNPRLDLELRATRYARDFGTRDPLSAGLVLRVPLYSGGRVDADKAAALADLARARAETVRYEYRLRQALLETRQDLLALAAQAQALDVQTDYRELYLDRSRALYELQIKTDLGDAMVQQSATRSRRMANRFRRALAWETLAVLTGDARLEPDTTTE